MMPKAGGQYVFLREGLSPARGLSLRLDAVRRHPDRHHRRGGGGLRQVPRRAGARRSRPTSSCRSASSGCPGAAEAIQLGLSPQRVVAIAHDRRCSPPPTCAASPSARPSRRCSASPRSARSRRWCCSGLTLFRQPDIAAANFADFWGTGDWSLAVIPVIGAAMVGSLFSSDAWNNVTFAAAEVQNPSRNLPRALAIGTGTGEPALHPRQRRLPQHAAVRGRPATAATCSRAGCSTPRRTGWAPPPSRWRWAPAPRR